MARRKKSTPEVAKVEVYLKGVAKSLVDRLYGPDGPAWGTKMAELEDVVVGIREVISEEMLAQALQRQAAAVEQRPEAYRNCPGCGKVVQDKPGGPHEAEPRGVQTRAGQAQWVEPEKYCRTCRRSFFPSEQEPGA